MPIFRKKRKVEDFVSALITTSVPNAITFFHEENQRATTRLPLDEQELKSMGAAMSLFFLSGRFTDPKGADRAKLQRAYQAVRQALSGIGGNPDKAHAWWEAMEGGQLLRGNEDPLSLACHVVWDRKFPERSFKQHGPLRSFAHFIRVEVDAARHLKLV